MYHDQYRVQFVGPIRSVRHSINTFRGFPRTDNVIVLFFACSSDSYSYTDGVPTAAIKHARLMPCFILPNASNELIRLKR